jgi:signal transduction histidine kinase/ActR/RegA family two-component response regulator
MTIQNKLLAGFAVLLLMFSVLLGHSMISLYRVATAQDDAADAARTLDLAGEMRAVIAEMSGAERELRISRLGNWPESPAEIRNSHLAMFQRFDHAAQSISKFLDQAAERASMEEVRGSVAEWKKSFLELTNGPGTDDFGPRLDRLAPLTARMTAGADELSRFHRRQLQRADEENDAGVATAKRIEIGLLFGVIALTFWWTRKWRAQDRTLLEATRLAEAASLAKSEFLATVSHELRTPMNGVLGMQELLLATSLTAEQRGYLTLADDSARGLLLLLNDLLDLSKVEAARLDLNEERFNFRNEIGPVTGLLGASAKRAGLSYSVSIDGRIPEFLIGDAGCLRRVLTNLIGNAVKFTSEGSITISAALLESSASSILLRLAVEDTGPGIEADMLPRIFQPFTQADSSMSRRFGGSGLGLAISKRVAERMGGSIEVESVFGGGSAFSFTVPFALDSATATPCSPSPASIAGASAQPLGLNVLLAEDNPVNQKVAMRFLERLGCTVTVASNGREAVDHCCLYRYDVVIMDCQMPEMDGFEATRLIRASANELVRRTPIVAMTANAMPEDRARCLAAGMNDYLAKPVSMALLSAALKVYKPSDQTLLSSQVTVSGP